MPVRTYKASNAKWPRITWILFSFHFNPDKDPHSFRFLVQANKMSELLWTIYFWGLVFVFVSTVVIYMCFVLFCWLTQGRIIIDKLYRPFKVMWVYSFWCSKQRVYIDWNIVCVQFTLESICTTWICGRISFCHRNCRSIFIWKRLNFSTIHIDVHSSSCILQDVQILDQ